MAATGQQTPIVVVAAGGGQEPERYVVIDGYKRIAALGQLHRDTVEAVLWPLSEAEALVLERSMRMSEKETALEQGWLLSELEERFGYGLEELAERFDRSVSWVSRRLALVDLLPKAIQEQVREGKLTAHVAMKYLVPVARASLEDCEQMAAALARHRCTTREAGQIYAAWRQGTSAVRARVLEHPELFLKVQREAKVSTPAGPAAELLRDLEMVAAIVARANRRFSGAAPEMSREQLEQARVRTEIAHRQLGELAGRIGKEQHGDADQTATNHDPGAERTEGEQGTDRPPLRDLAPVGAQSPQTELGRGAHASSAGESCGVPPADPRSVGLVQRQSRASP